jgi:hypothetical protein
MEVVKVWQRGHVLGEVGCEKPQHGDSLKYKDKHYRVEFLQSIGWYIDLDFVANIPKAPVVEKREEKVVYVVPHEVDETQKQREADQIEMIKAACDDLLEKASTKLIKDHLPEIASHVCAKIYLTDRDRIHDRAVAEITKSLYIPIKEKALIVLNYEVDKEVIKFQDSMNEKFEKVLQGLAKTITDQMVNQTTLVIDEWTTKTFEQIRVDLTSGGIGFLKEHFTESVITNLISKNLAENLSPELIKELAVKELVLRSEALMTYKLSKEGGQRVHNLIEETHMNLKKLFKEKDGEIFTNFQEVLFKRIWNRINDDRLLSRVEESAAKIAAQEIVTRAFAVFTKKLVLVQVLFVLISTTTFLAMIALAYHFLHRGIFQ